MHRRRLIQMLEKAGWIIIHGAKHDAAKHPARPGKLIIPREKEINEFTARGILKDAGLM